MSSGPPLPPERARRRFLLLTATRWFPVGLVVGIMTLLPLERGLSISQALTASAVSGFVIFALELPTAGFADSAGRRPVVLLAAAAQVVAASLLVIADSFAGFVAASAVMGLFRALDSGPLEAWYVDTVHATRPGADVDGTLARAGTTLGISMAAGALVSGGLVWWHPVPIWSALTLPFVLYAVLAALHLLAILVFMTERRTPVRLAHATKAVRQAARTVRDGIALLRGNRVLRCLLAVELAWPLAMVVFESIQPIRLAELLGSEERSGAWMGPVASAGWAVFALGSALAGLCAARIGVSRTAICARVFNGLGAVTMGLAAGPVGLIAAYLMTYGLHGSCGPMHNALLHREATAANRATVLSMNSMTAFAAFAVAAPLLGMLSDATTTQTAMITGGALSVLGAIAYLPARRSERARTAATSAV